MADCAAGRKDAAREALLALDRDGALPDAARVYLGALLVEAGDVEAGIVHLRAAVESSRRAAEARWILAQALLVAGHGHEAVKELERVVKAPGILRAPAKALLERVRAAMDDDT